MLIHCINTSIHSKQLVPVRYSPVIRSLTNTYPMLQNTFFALVLLLTPGFLSSQYLYEVTDAHPYGQPNPEAPEAVKAFTPLMGKCSCKSTSRLPDGNWAEPIDMTWSFKYIMNGYAVQDETLKADGKHSGSIRQYDAEEETWLVHYYSTTPKAPLPHWTGGKVDEELIFSQENTAPNGAEGTFRLRFHDINKNGYQWVGAWYSKDESIIYPTWKIDCARKGMGE
jgi:hypothetical protein